MTDARVAWVTGASRGIGRGAAIARRRDLLVNNAWGGYAGLAARQWDQWTAPLTGRALDVGELAIRYNVDVSA
jgi:NAD(P)-dependent dehydrogenase (short-subunit alcohol dehydrogenase family)